MAEAETLKVLVGCERSGIVRNAFLERGYDAWSCDLAQSEDQTNRHIQDDVRNVLKYEKWDLLMVAHPPCTRLCNSGVRWLKVPPPGRSLKEMWDDLRDGAALFSELLNADVPHKAIENPVMHRYAKELIENFVPATQSVQPWEFATVEDGLDNVKKRTCFWLSGLPKLRRTGTLDGSTARADIHLAAPGPQRSVERSRFFPAMAAAIADQWGEAALSYKGREVPSLAKKLKKPKAVSETAIGLPLFEEPSYA